MRRIRATVGRMCSAEALFPLMRVPFAEPSGSEDVRSPFSLRCALRRAGYRHTHPTSTSFKHTLQHSLLLRRQRLAPHLLAAFTGVLHRACGLWAGGGLVHFVLAVLDRHHVAHAGA